MKRIKIFPKKKTIEREVEKEREKEPLVCYECKKFGHLRVDCPYLKKRREKALMATQSDSEESFENEQSEAANLCLMVCEKEVQSKSFSNMYFNELYKIFHDLFKDYKKINKKKKELKIENQSLIK